tara:strand:- start:2732 stop:3334 length:603 start_codon:yes stop_codon:yes gene_type:complete
MCHPAVFTAMGASTATATTLAAVAPTIVGVAGSTLMSVQSARASVKYAEEQNRLEQQAISEQANQQRIEKLQLENNRTEEYLDRLAANRAALAGLGITEQGGSLRALLDSNRETYKKDLRTISLNYSLGLSNLATARATSNLGLQAAKSSAKADQATAIFSGITALSTVADEFRVGDSPTNKTTVKTKNLSDQFKNRQKI